jgi:hypothetical protein
MINCWYPGSKFIYKDLQSHKVYFHQQIPEESHRFDFINNFDCSFFNDKKEINENNSSLTDTKHQLSPNNSCEEDYLFENSSLEIIEKSLINDALNITDMMDDLLKMDNVSIQISSGTEAQQKNYPNEVKRSITKTIDFKLIEEKIKQRLLSRNGNTPKQHEQASFFFNNKSCKKSKLKSCKK